MFVCGCVEYIQTHDREFHGGGEGCDVSRYGEAGLSVVIANPNRRGAACCARHAADDIADRIHGHKWMADVPYTATIPYIHVGQSTNGTKRIAQLNEGLPNSDCEFCAFLWPSLGSILNVGAQHAAPLQEFPCTT